MRPAARWRHNSVRLLPRNACAAHGSIFRSYRIRPQSFPICYMAARFVITPADLRGCWRFVALSIASCALPALLASLFR